MEKKKTEKNIKCKDLKEIISEIDPNNFDFNSYKDGCLILDDESSFDGAFKNFRHYDDLKQYLDNKVIPKCINNTNKTNIHTIEDESCFSIKSSYLLNLGLTDEQLNYTINYLNYRGIVIKGKSIGIADEIPNYQHIVTRNRICGKEKFEKNNDEEIKLFELYKKTGDKKIREKIIINNIRLAVYLAYRYGDIYKVDRYELESYAFEGLCRAVDNFDYTIGNHFSSFASSYVKGFIKNGVMVIKNNYRDRCYTHLYYKVMPYIIKVENLENKKINEDDKLIEKVLDLMTDDGIIVSSQRDNVRKYIYSNLVLSLDNDNIDVLIDDKYEEIHEKSNLIQLKEIFKEILSNGFTENEIIVLTKRFGLDGYEILSLEDIGKELGVTRERIRQIQAKALAKLRMFNNAKKLKDFYYDNNDESDNITLYNCCEDDSYYIEDIYDENYDYKKPPRR